MALQQIELRGVHVHNLQHVDLDVPHRRLTVLCGVSGSGKTSLALDTLYAEGQRRYIETFPAYTRQFLERLEKPAAERIDGLPPAIAVTRKNTTRSSRSTVATATEIGDYLRLLFAKLGAVVCPGCGRTVRRDSPQSVARVVAQLPAGTRFLVAFPRDVTADDPAREAAELREAGFVRVVAEGRTWELDNAVPTAPTGSATWLVVVDRLAAGADPTRVRDSLETAFEHGRGRCTLFVAEDPTLKPAADPVLDPAPSESLDGRSFRRLDFSRALACEPCGRSFVEPEPRLFSFNSPLGACPACTGFGTVVDLDPELIVPDPNKSLRDGAIEPWNGPECVAERTATLAAAERLGWPVDRPWRDWPAADRRVLFEGDATRDWPGLRGLFAGLEGRKSEASLRGFVGRWKSSQDCPACGGSRLRPEALVVRLDGKNFAEVSRLRVDDAAEFFDRLVPADWQRPIAQPVLTQLRSRLAFLRAVGVGYLSLDRSFRTLSGGEAQRVALTTALGSTLVHMLYVLDEPSVGLHPHDIGRLLDAVRGLCRRGNTVVLVEHEPALIRAADQVVEVGPGAGASGGEVVFMGAPDEMIASPDSLTGAYLAGRRGASVPEKRRPPRGVIRLSGARGHNLQRITVDFPLGVLCLVTGVSGAGKSTLVQDTLYPALCRRKRKPVESACPFDDVYGDGQIDDVVLVDQSPIGKSPRSNPVTFVKAFDEIRRVYAETIEARTHNYGAGHFSFNIDGGGRCGQCEGDGWIAIDMQFLADVYKVCPQCRGQRYRKEILAVKYRGKNIAEVLDMTVREAFAFFRGQAKVQSRLKRLMDVGLDYLRLGQPANTLSAGESQRLKLASYLTTAGRNRTLFLLDEPTTGLHFADIVKLIDCFEALLSVGHSLVVVEHNVQLMKAADFLLDLGPGPGEAGGRLIARGTPEEVARNPESITGRFLAEALRE